MLCVNWVGDVILRGLVLEFSNWSIGNKWKEDSNICVTWAASLTTAQHWQQNLGMEVIGMSVEDDIKSVSDVPNQERSKNETNSLLPLAENLPSLSEGNDVTKSETSSVLPSDACEQVENKSSKEVIDNGSQITHPDTGHAPNLSHGVEISNCSTLDMTILQPIMQEADGEVNNSQMDTIKSFESSYERITDREDSIKLITAEPSPTQKETVQIDEKEIDQSYPEEQAVIINRAEIDTAAPFESVKEAVTMFGGIVDWKAQKILNMEKRHFIEVELQRVQEELPVLKKQLVAAEDEKLQVLQELDHMKKHIEELTLNLERAQTAEEQATQDSELARLRVEEMEKGITDEVSVAWKTQIEVAKARHATAIEDLQSVNNELGKMKAEYQHLMNDKNIAIRKAEEALHASEEMEKKVDELTLELIATKDSLEMAHIMHQEAEEQRVAAAAAKDQEAGMRAREIKLATAELERLKQELALSEDLNSKLETASSLLQSLKEELASYKEAESKLAAESAKAEEQLAKEMDELEQVKVAEAKIITTLESTGTELEELRENLKKETEEVIHLTGVVGSLREELEGEKVALATMHQREGMASVAVAALEAELKKTNEELELVQSGEKEAKETMAELPKALQRAAAEADEAKVEAEVARANMRKSKEEIEQARAATSTAESRLQAAIKEMEAARASELIALNAIKALNKSESAEGSMEASSSAVVTLTLGEYYALNKRAHEAEELANNRFAAATAQIDAAKDNQKKVMKKLEEANKEINARKDALQDALKTAGEAKAGKLAVEDELRKWRAEHEQRRKAGDAVTGVKNSVAPQISVTNGKAETGLNGNDQHNVNEIGSTQEAALRSQSQEANTKISSPDKFENIDSEDSQFSTKRKKKSLFPRIVMFLVRKRNQLMK